MEIVSPNWTFQRFVKCSNCSKSDITGKIKACSVCGVDSYCNVKCQRDHWNIHKDYCKEDLKHKYNEFKNSNVSVINNLKDEIINYVLNENKPLVYIVSKKRDNQFHYFKDKCPGFINDKEYKKYGRKGYITKYMILELRKPNIKEIYIIKNKLFIYDSFYTGIPDIDIYILNKLSDEEILAVSQVNKYLYEICDEVFWRARFKLKHGTLLEDNKLYNKTYRAWCNYYGCRSNVNSCINHDHLKLFICKKNRKCNCCNFKITMFLNGAHYDILSGNHQISTYTIGMIIKYKSIDILKYVLSNKIKIEKGLFHRILKNDLPFLQAFDIIEFNWSNYISPKVIISATKKCTLDIITFILSKINYNVDIITIKKCMKISYATGKSNIIDYWENAFPNENLNSNELTLVTKRIVKRNNYNAFKTIYNRHQLIVENENILTYIFYYNRFDIFDCLA